VPLYSIGYQKELWCIELRLEAHHQVGCLSRNLTCLFAGGRRFLSFRQWSSTAFFCFFSRFCHCTVVEENRWTAIPWRHERNVFFYMHERLKKSKWCPSEKNRITRIRQYYFSSSFVANEYGKSKRESNLMFINFDKLELLRCNRARRSGHGGHQLWSQGSSLKNCKISIVSTLPLIAAHCRIDPIDLVLGCFLSYESMRHWMS
jgi:hypothetical protein